MRKVHFATTNKGKVSSVGGALRPYGIEVAHYPIELPEPRSDSLKEIARSKVVFAYDQIKRPCFALDSGFYVGSLNGFPRTFVNFALDTIGIEGILKLVDSKPRDCVFKNCLAYLDSGLTEPAYFESEATGVLSDSPAGDTRDYHWSELFKIFIPTGSDKTLAEMSFDEYQGWRRQRQSESFTTKFGEWFSKREEVG